MAKAQTGFFLFGLLAANLVTLPEKVSAQVVVPMQTLVLPGTGSSSPTITTNSIFNLPGYGNVLFSVNAATPANLPITASGEMLLLSNKIIPASFSSPKLLFEQNIRMIRFKAFYNSASRDYNISFRFLNGPPNVQRIRLLVYSLGTKAFNQSNTSSGSNISQAWTRLKINSPTTSLGSTYVDSVNSENVSIVNGFIQNPFTMPPGVNIQRNAGAAAIKPNFPFLQVPVISGFPPTTVFYPVLTIQVNQIMDDEFALTLSYLAAGADS